MNVRKRLQLNTAASAITVLAVAVVVALGLYRIDHTLDKLDVADEILKGAFQRYTLLHDYLMTGNERAKVQWFAEHSKVGNALRKAVEEFVDPEDKTIITNMIKDHDATAKLFKGLVDTRDKMKSGRITLELAQAIENRLLTQVNIRLYDKLLNIDELRATARTAVFSELKLTGAGIVIFIIIAAVIVAVGSWTMGRFISNRINMLHKSASIIGQGDLDHRITIKGDDEFADLSKAFNTMTDKLKISYLALQGEIAERKRAEEKMQQLNDELEHRVAERTELAVARAKQLQSLTFELIETEERERRQFAYLLHDDLQQMLAAARMQLQAISDSAFNQPILDDVIQLLKESIEKSRHLSHELSPTILYHSGLYAALQWLAQRMREQFGLEVELENRMGQQYEFVPLKTFLFRAVQELLFNVVKHSGVKCAGIVLCSSSSDLTISVSDAGKGFDPDILRQAKSGFGLLSIQERASYMGGCLAIDSTPGRGSCFTLVVPLSSLGGDDDRHQPPVA